MKGFTTYWDRLNLELGSRLEPWIRAAFGELEPGDTTELVALIGDGKRLRGRLVLAVCDALSGSTAQALPAAIAVECVHAASLIHDDLIDGDRVRRQKPATWTVHGARRAVLLGDLVFATALHESARLGRDQVLTLSRAIALVAAGAYKEPDGVAGLDSSVGSTGSIDSSNGAIRSAGSIYDRIIRLKTAALFEAAAELGAIAAGATVDVRQAALRFGSNIGCAYQIADDLHDIVLTGHDLKQQTDSRGQPSESTELRLLRGRFGGGVSLSRQALAAAMRVEITRQIEQADLALGAFPAGARLAMLRALPRAVLGVATIRV